MGLPATILYLMLLVGTVLSTTVLVGTGPTLAASLVLQARPFVAESALASRLRRPTRLLGL
jgi:hypothetical protein